MYLLMPIIADISLLEVLLAELWVHFDHVTVIVPVFEVDNVVLFLLLFVNVFFVERQVMCWQCFL
jgi:hypothetical protein